MSPCQFSAAFKPGDTVRVADGDIAARVQLVQFSVQSVRYCVTWWDSGTRREDWFDEDEMQPADARPRKLSA